MSKEKGFKLILIIISTWLLINVGANTFNFINQQRLVKEVEERRDNYKINRMRFPIKINKGEYKVIDCGDQYLLDIENGLKQFEESSEFVYLDEINTKYSEYIITKDTTYVCANIDYSKDYMQYIEYPVPISENSLNNLKSFMEETDNDSIEVIPFNDGIYCFVSGKAEQYILNIENKELLWTRGGYYESPEYDPIKDTVTCGGDLSSTKYVFNKYGELVQTKGSGITTAVFLLGILNLSTILSIFVIVHRIIKHNIKSISLKILSYMILLSIILLIGLIMLWLSFYFIFY